MTFKLRGRGILTAAIIGLPVFAFAADNLSSGAPMNSTSTVSLAAGFIEPPSPARAGAFWPWLNGNADRDRIVFDLQQMKQKGLSGAEIWDVEARQNIAMVPTGPEFLSAESTATIRFALQEARKLGLTIGMIASSGWNAGGTWVTPDWASKMLVSSTTVTTGPCTFSGKLKFPDLPKDCPLGPDGLPVFYKDIAVIAVPASVDKKIKDPSQIIDLTDQLQPDGTLTWDAPDGAWSILRFVCTNTGQTLIVPSPKSSGLFIDFLDPDATRRHLKTILDKLGITRGNAAEIGLEYLEVDSMELHEGNPWTDRFSEWFIRYRGYSPRQWLPILAGWTIQDKSTSDGFLYDYRKTVSDLLIHSHYETGSEFLEQYGMEFVGEAGGPGPPIWDTCPVDALKALGNVTIPRGEFWIQHRNIFLVKEVASAAHIYGKTIVDAESWTTWRRWEDAPFALKTVVDRAFAEGLNHVTVHTFAHSPESAGLPGHIYHAGVDINPNVTWWPYARPFFDYIARCSWMLRQGLPVADVLWYYGDQAPNFFPSFNDVPEKPRLPGLGRGYDFDVINSDVILNRLKVQDGRYVLPEGTSYRVLAIAPDAAVTAEVIARLQQFVAAGGVLVGAPPRQSPGLFKRATQEAKLDKISRELWGDAPSSGPITYKTGRVYNGVELDNVLAMEGIAPDFQVVNSDKEVRLDYIHRRTNEADIYFIRNENLKPTSAAVRFRTTRGTPQLWDPITGDRKSTSSFTRSDNHSELNVQLPAGGSLFVVFSSDSSAPLQPAFVTLNHKPIRQPWVLSFPPNLGAPTSVTLSRLKPWNKSEDPGVRYFSGTGTYETSVTLNTDWLASGNQTILDLGEVRDIAEVIVNGESAGIQWAPPYRFNISEILQTGDNTIQVKVTNLWHNRLVGDAQLPPEKRITQSNFQYQHKEKAKLQKSGLMGPVVLERVQVSP